MTASNLTRDEARARATLLADLAYDVDLDLTDPTGDTFTSTTRVRFTCRQPGARTFIDLAAATVRAATLNGEPFAVDGFDGTRVELPPLAESNELVIVADCAYSRAGVGLHRFTDPVDQQVFCYTQFEPFDAHRVFACFDQPDLKGPFTFAVDAPAGWEVVSNERVRRRPEPGAAGRWEFDTTPPLSTYVTALVAGPYHHVHDRHGDIELGLWCRPSLAEHLDPDELFELTRQGLDWFSEQFAYPYPFTKYDQLFVPEFNFGAMENPGCVTFSERYVFRSRVTQAARLQRGNTLLHEMAHMWFGDLVTMRWWDDLWLNESFATFMSHTALAAATRFGAHSWADFAHANKAWAYQQDQLPTTHPIVAEVVDTHSVMANFDGITYAKGASVLKQLSAWVGGEAFMAGLREYFPAHEWGNAELDDFLAALERPSGRDLKPWSRDWLETSGVNTLSPEIVRDGDVLASVAIVQRAAEATPTLRPHRIAIGLYDEVDGRLVRRDLVETDVRDARTEVPALAGVPAPDLLLLNDEDLTYAKIRLDEGSLQALERSLSTIAEPVARAVCWGALWDGTRDAEIPARRFAELVATHGPSEGDIGVLQALLRQAMAGLERYGDPANLQAGRERLAALARDRLAAAEPGSDRQLIWARALAATRTDPSFARALLDGTDVPPGLEVDHDLRWFLVAQLAAQGVADEDLIAAEEERDPTDIGARGAAAARAARPTAEAKEQAWAAAVDSDELPLAMRKAILDGFWQVEQDELLWPYATERWMASLPPLWQGRSAEEGIALTTRIYPHTVIAPEILEAADRAIAQDGLPEVARRSIRERRDGTRRALAARKADR